ncbi:TetR/AcrR family transcriptional regulator [Steroidobacter sp.]|uniref:TetR/AcrR family transcriptional regulator n=1 Tax=Steroidobacter sp. TaxID=1978227 RepID=UPI001A3841D5|nr:TetR/AcrR family transcriptional regulator [Steroidobacter sp.]MBL8270512.1 TetR/AcrR family transcriptional regulator [Steroidobacter sp.]
MASTSKKTDGKKPSTEKFHKRRETIVRAAVEVMNRRGVRGMTLADVARRLDLVAPAVMYYFKSKEELAATVYYRSIERYEQLIAAAEREPTARDALERLVRGYFEFTAAVATGEAEAIAGFNDIRALQDPGLSEAFLRMFRSARSLLLKPGMPAGLERTDHNARTLLLFSQLAWSVVWAPRYHVDDYSRLADHTLDILENGILPPGKPWHSPALQVAPVSNDKNSAARETFLQAATLLVNERGYLGASVQKISEHLNLTKGAFYHHLENKDDLIVACFRRTLDILRKTLKDAGQVANSGAEHLLAASCALTEYQLSGNTLLRTSALTSVPEEIGTSLLNEFDRNSGRISLVLTDGIADGSLRPVDTNIAAQMITAMINAAAEVHWWAPGVTQQNVAQIHVRPMFEGLLRGR